MAAAAVVAPCEYKFLGACGLKVSNICLGAMTFGAAPDGRPGQCDDATAHAIMDRFVALGGNFIDTADVYARGESERVVGSWLAKQKRDRIIIATKVRFPNDPTDPNGSGLSRHHILTSCDESLARLQTSYIDLYQWHCWDNGTPLRESLEAVRDLVRAGKIRYFGVSNVTGWQLQKICDYSKEMGIPLAALQTQYSLLCRWVEWELTEVCKFEGLGLLPWSPLKGGWLSGKIRKGMTSAPEGSRIAWAEETGSKLQSAPTFSTFASNDSVLDLVELLAAIGAEAGRTIPQVAIRWLLQRSVVPSVIIGAKTVAQLEDNMGAAAGWSLSAEQMARLDKASALDVPYPYEMINRSQGGRDH